MDLKYGFRWIENFQSISIYFRLLEGQTKKQLKKRLQEHASDINRRSKSVISNHCIDHNHNFKWDIEIFLEILD